QRGEVNSSLLSAELLASYADRPISGLGAARATSNGGPMPEAEANNGARSRTFAIRVVATAAVVAALGFGAFMLASPSVRPRGALIGGAFALQDGSGKTVSEQTLRGHPFLVYFGYTHCPDV